MSLVQLAVYDLSGGMASALSQSILGQRIEGIWHTGILVFHREYFFGGGIQALPIGHFSATRGLHPVRVLDLGVTHISEEIFAEFLENIRPRFMPETYDLLHNNCNNFSHECSQFLLGTGIPSYIIDLPRTVLSSPGGAMLRPMIESMSRGAYSADPFAQQQPGPARIPPSQTSNSYTYPTRSSGILSYGSSSGASVADASRSAAPRDVTVTGVASDGMSTASETFSNLATAPRRGEERVLLDALNEAISAPTTDPRVSSASLGTRETIINKPLVSGDRDPALVKKLGSKILSQQIQNGSGIMVNVVSPSDAQLIESVVDTLTSNQPHGSATFSSDTFRLLLRLIDECPPLQTACLFFLRLMVLYQADVNETLVSTVHTVSKKLNRSQPAKEPKLASGPAQFMAMCTVANFFSRIPACALEGTAATLDHIVDAAIAELCGPVGPGSRPETRQVSAAALHNLVLMQLGGGGQNGEDGSNADSSNTPLEVIQPDINTVGSTDVHPHVVQILCSTLEGIEDEADHTVLHRRVSIAYNILSCASATRDLFIDLGFKDTLQNLREKLRHSESSKEEVLNSIDQLMMLL